jgi:proteasome lid subunit RPN8/RPN11
MRIEAQLSSIAPRLQQLAASAKPAEACGLISVNDDIVSLLNAAADPTRDFDVGPLHVLAAGFPCFRAIWHTHPDDEPPSAPDIAGCSATAVPWIIAGPTKLWVLHPRKLPYICRDFTYGSDDCWQLVSDWFAGEKGIFLPWFPRPPDRWWHESGPSPYLEAATAYGFAVRPIAEHGFADLKTGDVLLMKIAGLRVNHAAVYIGGGAILHHLYGCLSEIVQLDDRLQRLTLFVGRHESLSHA